MTNTASSAMTGAVRPLGAVAAGLVFLAAAQGAVAQEASAQVVDCVIEPRSVVTLVAPSEGMISEIPVDRGDHVTSGQVVARLDDELQKLQIELAQARAQSDVQIRAQTTRLSLREKEYLRAKRLSERNVTATTVLEDAEIEMALTKLAIEEATIARKFAGIEARQAEAMLKRREVRSPVDGIVTAVLAAPGEFAHQQLDIMTIAEIDPLHVEVFVPTSYFNKIKVGEVLTVRQLPPLDGVFQARVTIVDQIFDAASGTFGLRLEIDNPDGAIPAGTRCQVEFQEAAARQ